MDSDEMQAPYQPEAVDKECPGSVRQFCVSPTNGRLEWIQATVQHKHLNKGSAITQEMKDFVSAGNETLPRDQPALIIHQSIGGIGDDVYNVFLQGSTFDRDVYDNDVESSVYYALKDDTANTLSCVVTVRFVFKNDILTRPYKFKYTVQLPNGDSIENELLNV